ncbi:MAG TPA: hypothetical protein PLI34_13700, partial [Saprospiraceae bacterium]|nr:hypothetical protein [Saprospiraceae bacterium]
MNANFSEGREVHGRIRIDPARERLGTDTDWIIVTRTDSAGPRQIRISALALDRDLDVTTGALGEHDGSAG